ncbi:S8 family peptidase [Cytobacillus kochii]|uniref:S8 family peptidase n=1 Tax=Cytobacillus kochii TaxID=859143 RepID=UPI001CD44679|nr:S8 family serine peptidase [Cytobacillus kochii]MCA1024938.1 S8 family serine peptidase [Cytobacillus kochii]MCM3324033.1 S8 family serine peptidase [Cytobacillus kochii]MCM3346563.1 S8 family serine peptidase [Cytobacillus kochii]MDM5206630.1 S8 family serine peptidase [Cytobacillus kochii]
MTKKKTVAAALLSLTLGMSVFTSGISAQVSDEAKGSETYRVLIQAPSNSVNALETKYEKRWDFGKEGFTADVNAKELQTLQATKNVEVQKVNEMSIATVTGEVSKAEVTAVPSSQTPWGIKSIYNNQSLTATSGGNGIKVAVLDTGVYTNHIDLAGSAEQCKDFTQSSPLVNGSCTDRQGHGTHVAGTVLAHGGSDGQGVYGVAPDAKLWAYKVLGDNGSGYSDDIAAAIRHVADQATSTGSKVVINMSLGSSGKDSLISSAVDYAYNKGVLVVAAAGNSGSGSNTIGYPGALVNAVAVAALENVQQNGTYRVANFSSRGNPSTDGDYVIQERDIEVSAPGAAVESTWYNGGYNTISGTSMATPHVAGLAAKIWAANPSWSKSTLRTELQNRAKVYDIKGGVGATTGDDYASGFGYPRVK